MEFNSERVAVNNCGTASAMGGDAIPEGFIRLSVGCEDVEDLIADSSQALDVVAAG